jgi:hypothetical protein
MHTVYSCSHPVDAHLIANLLTQHGIEAQVFGEFLIGAAGELPPGNLVRVVIPDATRIDEALQIIADWESCEPFTI